jgi:hypothetical protein
MTQNVKAAIGILIAALIAALAGFWTSIQNEPVTNPSPVPSVVVSALPSPIPSPTPSPTPIAYVPDLILMKGETSEIVIRRPVLSCGVPVVTSGLSVSLFRIDSVTTTKASASTFSVGTFEDPLVSQPDGCAKNLWIDVKSIGVSGKEMLSVDGKTYNVLVLKAQLPLNPTMPAYTEYRSWNVMKAHGLADNVTNQAAIAVKYSGLLREHRIEPIKHWVLPYPSADLNQWSTMGGSYKQMVLDNRIAPPCIFGPDLTADPSVATLTQIEGQLKSGALPPDAWAYIWDEGQTADLAKIQARSALIRTNAPTIRQMATWEPIVEVKTLLNVFAPVMDWFKQPNGHTADYAGLTYWLYTSCMAQGSCSTGTGTPTGTPMFVLEADHVHQRAFPVIGYQLGAKAVLYYKADKMISTALTAGGLFNEGGNGDGTLLYAIGTGPASSVRLKAWRKGMNDVEYLQMLGVNAPVLALSTKTWTKSEADYNNLRVLLAKKEGSL